jgi:hypothetical protein
VSAIGVLAPVSSTRNALGSSPLAASVSDTSTVTSTPATAVTGVDTVSVRRVASDTVASTSTATVDVFVIVRSASAGEIQ